MVKLIAISLGIVVAISLGVGFVFSEIIGFWQGFVAAVLAQFISTYGFATFRTVKNSTVSDSEAQLNQLLELQTIEVTCPCSHVVSKSPVFFNTDNVFTCTKCNSKFKIEPTYDSILLTEPLNIENAYNFLKSKEQ